MADSAASIRLDVLRRDHDLSAFDCGIEALNDYLRRFAWTNQQAGSARTYVADRNSLVVGYYSLAFGSVEYSHATDRARKGLARHPLPALLIARLAVDRSEQGHGLGKSLLKDAMLRSRQAAQIAGLRVIVVRAKDDAARKFYERSGFQRSPLDEWHLMFLMKDLKLLLPD